MNTTHYLDAKDYLKIVLFVIVFALFAFFTSRFPDEPEESQTLEEYKIAVSEFEDLDSELHRKYGIYPESALTIVSCYAEFEDHDGVTFDEYENAWMLLREYYYKSREIILPLY